MFRFLIVLTLFVSCTGKNSNTPEDWRLWVETKQEDFNKNFAVPTITQHIYLKEGERAFLTKDERGIRLVPKSCSHNCMYSLIYQKGQVLIKDLKTNEAEKVLSDKEPTKVNQYHSLSYYFYEPEKKARVFLYDLSQKDLAKKRKRSFFDYSSPYRVTGRFNWDKETKVVKFGRSDGSSKDFQVVAKIKYQLKGKEGELTVYNFDASKKFDKSDQQTMLMYRDLANNKKTYGAGRFLNVDFGKPMSELKEGDVVVVDFNYSYNPPCATSTGFHCPLPQDMVAQDVLAGEKYYKFH